MIPAENSTYGWRFKKKQVWLHEAGAHVAGRRCSP